MDYLDPVRKKAHIRRLYAGYLLMGIAIFLATTILVFIGSGYVPGEGGLVQNGLLYVDSTPRDATVTLNGEVQRGKTDAKFTLPGDTYKIQLDKELYRPWSREVRLEDGKVRRVRYPRLYPVSLRTNIVQTNSSVANMIDGSLDRDFILVNLVSTPLTFQVISTKDFNRAEPALSIPASIVTSPSEVAAYKVVEWTEDSRFFLVQRTVGAVNEFLLMDREQPGQVRNLGREFGLLADAQLTMLDRSASRFVAFVPSQGTVRYIDLNNPAGARTVVTGAIQIASFESDKILYVTAHESEANKVYVRLLEGDKTYGIKEMAKSDSYLLDMAKFGSSLVMLAGSPSEGRVSVYRNPINYLKANPDRKYPVAVTTLRGASLKYASFSTDASVVTAYGGGEFASHEFEADQSYAFKLDTAIDDSRELRWMDSARLNFISDDSVYSVDFDGSNIEKLVAGRAKYGVFFSNNYETMFSFLTNKENTLFQITSTSLKAE